MNLTQFPMVLISLFVMMVAILFFSSYIFFFLPNTYCFSLETTHIPFKRLFQHDFVVFWVFQTFREDTKQAFWYCKHSHNLPRHRSCFLFLQNARANIAIGRRPVTIATIVSFLLVDLGSLEWTSNRHRSLKFWNQ